FLLDLGDGAGEIPALDAELDGDKAFAVFARDERAAGPNELAARIGPAVLANGGNQIAEPQPRQQRGVGSDAPADQGGARGTRSRGGGSDGLAGKGRLRAGGLGAGRHLIVDDINGDFEDRRLILAAVEGPAQGDVERLFSFHHLRQRFAVDGAVDDVVDVGHLHAPAFALVLVDGEFQVGLAHDAEDADALQAVNLRQDVFGFLGQLFQLGQVRSVNLDRVVPLDAGNGFHDVVANVLGKRPFDARQLGAQLGA